MFSTKRSNVRTTRPSEVGYTASMRSVCLRLMVVAFLVPFFAPADVLGAQIYLDPTSDTYGSAEEFSIPVRIEPQGECINAVEVTVAYDPANVRVLEVLTGDSIISLWISRPVIDNVAGRVTFMGGIPGGYCGRVPGDLGDTNILVHIIATGVEREGIDDRTIEFFIEPNTAATLNDGAGSLADLTVSGAALTLVPGREAPDPTWVAEIRSDTIAPEDFDIILVQGPSEGNALHYIVFSTMDKQSGISHYEVLETDPNHFGLLTWMPRKAHWVRAESPYILRDQTLQSTIMVKAVDKNGNERIVTYTPPMSPLVPFTKISILIPLLLLLSIPLILLALVVRLIRVRARVEEKDAYEKAKSQQPHDEQ
jgi:hypothetical protein